MKAGIAALNAYTGRASLDVGMLARARGLDLSRFENLLLREKTVAFPWEDPVALAVNAARPLFDQHDKRRVELLIVATESGIDFGKPVSTYVQHHLELPSSCRGFEVKHACYGGTAALQMAAAYIRAEARPGAAALVISTDAARPIPHTYAEPAQGATAVAMLVSGDPTVLELEPGCNGIHSYEVMDSCRPTPEIETGDADVSLLSYLTCVEQSFLAYQAKAGPVDFQSHFDYLAFHTPFGGMAKGAHRTMMRKFKRLPPPAVEEDFQRRMAASLRYCQRTGNIYSGTIFLALAAVIEAADFSRPRRVGLFSYGSGCCSEFYSGIATAQSRASIASRQLGAQLDARRPLTMPEYEAVLAAHQAMPFGVRDADVALTSQYNECFAGRGLLTLQRIRNYHREYAWS